MNKKLFISSAFILSLFSIGFASLASEKNININNNTVDYVFIKDGFDKVRVDDSNIVEINIPPKQNKIILLSAKKKGVTKLFFNSLKINKVIDISVNDDKKNTKKFDSNLELSKNTTKELEFPNGIVTILSGDSSKLTINVLPKQNKKVLLKGLGKGETNLLVWEEKNNIPKNYSIKIN